MNIFVKSLEDELVRLRARRVQLRAAIRHRSGPMCGDGIDAKRSIEFCLRELRSSELRWAELHHLLGRTMPSPYPVKIDRAAVRAAAVRAAAPRAAAAPARRRAVPGYVTRDMKPGR